MHIYAFGSLCRGEISPDSDVDLLALVEGLDTRFDPNVFSIYSYRRIQQLWKEGNPFAWHLTLESKLLFSSDHVNFVAELGSPSPYVDCVADCKKFFALFQEAHASILSESNSRVFDFSTVFLSIRNFATCFSLGMTTTPDFSRHSALHLGTRSLRIDSSAYQILERSRILATRGVGPNILPHELSNTLECFGNISQWMSKLLKEVDEHD